jgi:hypothetical protein
MNRSSEKRKSLASTISLRSMRPSAISRTQYSQTYSQHSKRDLKRIQRMFRLGSLSLNRLIFKQTSGASLAVPKTAQSKMNIVQTPQPTPGSDLENQPTLSQPTQTPRFRLYHQKDSKKTFLSSHTLVRIGLTQQTGYYQISRKFRTIKLPLWSRNVNSKRSASKNTTGDLMPNQSARSPNDRTNQVMTISYIARGR